ncbi:uncharacterized protein LOC129137611 isoform X1 [Pan troglodytes]|uniref:uncharacterized protein LOC129137611 isoform X1 n=1 Tax=Pan troglodytes TaxID=9598 RepID=UPI0030138B68
MIKGRRRPIPPFSFRGGWARVLLCAVVIMDRKRVWRACLEASIREGCPRCRGSVLHVFLEDFRLASASPFSQCLGPDGTGQNTSVHKALRSPLSEIPMRTSPAAAVSPARGIWLRAVCGRPAKG